MNVELWIVVWANETEIPPLDENPGHADQGLIVYRSKAAAESAAAHQHEEWGGDQPAKAMPLIEWLENRGDVIPANPVEPCAVDLIAVERLRQQRKGYDFDHDEGHGDGSLLVAAILIACGVADLELTIGPPDLQGPWPDQLAMHVAQKYGDDHARRLTIAAAMVAAEIDRLTATQSA